MLVTPAVLEPAQREQIRALVADLSAESGRDPLSDQALANLSAVRASVEHLLLLDSERVSGYAQRDGRSVEIASGEQAAGELLDAITDPDVLVWTHGRRSPLTNPLRRNGFRPVRELYQLRRPLTEPIDVPAAPDGVTIEAFVVDRDETAWLAVNADAFAHHAEQGAMTIEDLRARESEGWFDPSGFLLARRGDELLGFHWTKVHPDGAGEVYVLGVASAAQGLGLGGVLLAAGLARLREVGCREALLYVDGDNAGARRLYARDGFVEADLDVQWARLAQ